MIRVEIPEKLPGCNEYTKACRANKEYAAKLKRDTEQLIGYYIITLPKFTKPVKIHFHWIEGTKKRDLDNVCFAKKFILDSLVDIGILKDDNRKIVTGFEDRFEYANKSKVIVELEEL